MIDILLFSILVPVYNVSPYLQTCIDSVLDQSYGNFELLLVDDGSTDGSGLICDEYAAKDPRVRVFHKENGGLISARRYAVARFTGDYCLFLDADDSLAPGTLEVLERTITESGADCVLYGIRWNLPGVVQHIVCPEEICGRLFTDKRHVLNILLNDDSYNSLCRKCVKASCFDGRDYTRFFHISRGEDRLQSVEILENAQSFYFIPDELYIYRVNDSSITHTISYDGYRSDDTVDLAVQDLLARLGLFRDEDYARLRNHQLDGLVLEIKRICRYCSDRANRHAALQSLRESEHYQSFLSGGYRQVSVPSGVRPASSGLRRLLNRVCVFLFRHGFFHDLSFFCMHIYKAG